MKATARYPSHLISKSQSGPSNGSSMDVASMGWIAVGMGRLAGDETKTAEDAEDAEDSDCFLTVGRKDVGVSFTEEVFLSFSSAASASSASSAVVTCFCSFFFWPLAAAFFLSS